MTVKIYPTNLVRLTSYSSPVNDTSHQTIAGYISWYDGAITNVYVALSEIQDVGESGRSSSSILLQVPGLFRI